MRPVPRQLPEGGAGEQRGQSVELGTFNTCGKLTLLLGLLIFHYPPSTLVGWLMFPAPLPRGVSTPLIFSYKNNLLSVILFLPTFSEYFSIFIPLKILVHFFKMQCFCFQVICHVPYSRNASAFRPRDW